MVMIFILAALCVTIVLWACLVAASDDDDYWGRM